MIQAMIEWKSENEKIILFRDYKKVLNMQKIKFIFFIAIKANVKMPIVSNAEKYV